MLCHLVALRHGFNKFLSAILGMTGHKPDSEIAVDIVKHSQKIRKCDSRF